MQVPGDDKAIDGRLQCGMTCVAEAGETSGEPSGMNHRPGSLHQLCLL